MRSVLVIAATTMLLSPVAFAQGAQAPAATTTQSQAKPSLRDDIRADLQREGFSDVRVLPDSFLVEAKDKAGHPVTMMINPSSVTEVVADGSTVGGQASATASAFTTVPPTDLMSTKVVGLNVYNQANQDIGSIKDVVMSGRTVQAYILGVGGFLGMGDHYVAVTPSALHIDYNATDKTYHATMSATADQIKAAPEFKYDRQA